MTRIFSYLRLSLILAAQIAAALFLHSLGNNTHFQIDWSDLGGWLSSAQLEDLLAASLRLLGLVIAYYLIATTALYAIATAIRFTPLINALQFVTLPSLRRAVEKAIVAGAVTASVVAGPAHFASAATNAPIPFPPGIVADAPAQSDDSTTTTTEANQQNDEDLGALNDLIGGLPIGGGDSTPTTGASTTTTTTPRSDTADSLPVPGLDDQKPSGKNSGQDSGDTGDSAIPGLNGEEAPTTANSHTVVAGDSLWRIAKNHLADVRGVEANKLSNSEIASYWLKVIDANKDSLRSGNPDLIYPGEVISLPAV